MRNYKYLAPLDSLQNPYNGKAVNKSYLYFAWYDLINYIFIEYDMSW